MCTMVNVFSLRFDHKMKDCRPTCKVRLLLCRLSVPITRARCSSCLLGGALHTSRCYVPWCLGMRSPVTMAATSLETIMRIVNVKRVKGNLAFQLKLVISEFYILLSFNRQGSGAYRDKTPLHPPSSNGLVSCGKYTLRETDKRRKRKQLGEVETESCESSTLDGQKNTPLSPNFELRRSRIPPPQASPLPRSTKGATLTVPGAQSLPSMVLRGDRVRPMVSVYPTPLRGPTGLYINPADSRD